jgi:hypothetical protein
MPAAQEASLSSEPCQISQQQPQSKYEREGIERLTNAYVDVYHRGNTTSSKM